MSDNGAESLINIFKSKPGEKEEDTTYLAM